MILSRAKPATSSETAPGKEKKKKKTPKLEEFLQARDYTGAITLLEFQCNSGKPPPLAGQWIAYCAFHLGKYERAREEYEKLTKIDTCPPEVWINLACCYFMLGMYQEADIAAQKASPSPIQNRVQFHLAHKFNDEKRLMGYHQHLQNILEDQLSLAAIHYLRTHYQEAIDIYRKLLLENRDLLALNVYLAMCYHKLDYYDVSQEVLSGYVQHHPDSVIAINLKACNYYKLYNGKAAEEKTGRYGTAVEKILAADHTNNSSAFELTRTYNIWQIANCLPNPPKFSPAKAELKVLQDTCSSSFHFAYDLLQHNRVIFSNGDGALQVLPRLLDIIPEARLNLVIYYLRQGDNEIAYELIKDIEPTTAQEYILKAIANAVIGQERNSRENLKLAQQYYQLVGSSGAECDTIPGRQCMASCFFLLKQFEDVLIYLNSVKSYFFNDDNFNFNYAQAKAVTGNFQEAEEMFLLISSEKIKMDYVYISWLARCYIMNRKPQHAWELYLKMDTSGDSFSLLNVIANDCYKMGQFYYAARAFDILERLDPNPEYWEGKRGACVGVFQLVIAGHEPKESLKEVMQILRNTANSQAEFIIMAIKKWARDNRVPLPGL